MPGNEYDEILSNQAIGNAPEEAAPADVTTNEYDALLQEDKDTSRQVIRQNFIVADKSDPQKKARALKISDDLKVPVPVVERNMEVFEKQHLQKNRDYDQIIDRTPGLAEYLQSPDNAVFAKDDLDSLGKVEQNIKTFMPGKEPGNPLVDALSTGWANLEGAAAHLGGAYGLMDLDEAAEAAAAANRRSQELRDRAPTFSKEFTAVMEEEQADVNKAFNQFTSSYDSLINGKILKALLDYREGGINTAIEVLDLVATAAVRPRGLLYATAESAANSLPSLVGGLGGAAGGAAAGSAIPGIGNAAGGVGGFVGGSFAGGAPVEIGAWINQALGERGVDITDAEQIKEAYRDPVLMAEIRSEAVRKGVTTAGVDAVFSLFAGRFTAAARAGKATAGQMAAAVGKDLAVESTGEATSEFAGQVAARKGDLAKVDFGESIFEGVIGLGHSTGDVVVGASVRGAFSGDTVKATKQLARETRKAIAASESGRVMGDLGKTIKESKIGQIASGKVKEFIETVTGKEDQASVFFQTDEWDKHFKEQGRSPAKAAEQLLKDGGAVYHEARQAGGTMEIPMSEFVAEVATTDDYEALQKIARVEPDGMSVQESTEFLQDLPATLDELAEEAATTGSQQIENQQSAERVREEVNSQLVEGGMEQATAENYSQVYEAAFSSLGERTGIKPEELFKQFGLNINISQEQTAGGGVASGEKLEQAAVPKREIKKLKKQGFNTDEQLFHGGPKGIEKFRASSGNQELGSGVYLSLDQDTASGFGPQLYTVATKGKIFDYNFSFDKDDWATITPALNEAGWSDAKIDSFRDKGFLNPNALFRDGEHQADWDFFRGVLQEQGFTGIDSEFDSTHQRVVFNPEDVAIVATEAEPSLQQAPTRLQRAEQLGFDTSRTFLHSTVSEFGAFKVNPNGINTFGEGVYFSAEPDKVFIDQREKARTIEAFLRDPNPIDLGDAISGDREVNLAPVYEALGIKQLPLPSKKSLGPKGNSINNFRQILHSYKQAKGLKGGDADAKSELRRALIDAGFTSTATDPGTADEVKSVLDPKNIRSVDAEFLDPESANILAQPGDGERPRGQIRFGQANFNIDLLKDADLSTFLHETGHFYTEVLGDLSQRPDATPQIREDFDTLVKWAGFESVDKWNATPLEGRREAHEQIARGFEAYLMEGKAPTPALQAAFDRFKTWLTSIYRSIRGLDVELSNDVRNVFNRLLATEDELAQVNEDNASPAMFLEESGMKPEERAKYLGAIAKAKQSASEELGTKMLDTVRQSRTKEWKEKRKKVKAEVTEEVNAQPNYIALSALRKGTYPDGSELPEGLQNLKISRESLVDSFGAERTKNLPKPFVYAREGGIHHENVAEILGYSSGDEMITTFENTPKREDQINLLTDQRMNEEAGDLLQAENVTEEAEQAVANISRSRRLHLELKHLASADFAKFKGLVKKINRKPPPLEAIRAQAEQTINSRKVRQITPGIYKRAQAKHSKEAMDSMLRGDLDAAFLSKQRELFNHELHRAALNAKADVDSAVKFINKFAEKKTRQRIGKAGGTYLEQIDALMERFDFRRGVSLKAVDERKSLRDWVEAQTRDTGVVPVISDDLMNEANRMHYKDLTFNQLTELRDAVTNIDHLSRLKNKLLKGKRLREFDAAIEEGVASINENTRRPKIKELENRLPNKQLAKIGAGLLASHRKFSSLMRQMDGFEQGGIMWELFVRPLNDAADVEVTRNGESAEIMSDIFKRYDTKEKLALYKKVFIPEINDSLTRSGQLAVALNWGNKDSQTKLMEGRGWSREQVEAILDRLDQRDWEVVQAIWDHIDTFWEDTKSMARRVDGVPPSKVEAASVTTKFGEFKGGYYPLKYDESTSPRAFNHLAEEMAKRGLKGATVRSTTRSGHRKERVEGVKLPVRLDLGVAFEHVGQVIHDLTHYETLIDLNRLLGDPNMQQAVVDNYGIEIYSQMKNTISDVATGDVPAQTAFERSMNWLRSGVSISAMGWSVMTAAQQPLGLAQSIQFVGAKWIARGVSKWIGSPQSMENTVKWIHEVSPMMSNRAKTINREVNEIQNRIGTVSILPEQVKDSYFWMITRMQMLVDVPTWIGAYEKQLAQNADDESRAVAMADQAVLDTQAGGQIKDLAGIQKGGPLMKLFTNFYSFFATTYNMNAEAIGRTRFNKPEEVGRLAVDLLTINTFPAILGMLLKEGLRGDDEEEEFLKRAAREQISWLLGTTILTRELGGAVQGFYGYSGPAGTRFFAEANGLVKQIMEGEADAGAAKALNRTAGILLHYPAGQVERLVKGINATSQGDADVRSLLVGPPRK